jgi:hypothetical protein
MKLVLIGIWPVELDSPGIIRKVNCRGELISVVKGKAKGLAENNVATESTSFIEQYLGGQMSIR